MPNRSTIPAVQSRLTIDPLGNFKEKQSAASPAAALPPASPALANEQGEYNSSLEIACPRCSHDGCVHFHSSQRRLDRRATQGFLRYTENTLFTKHSRGEMPGAIAGPPLEFDTCHLAAFKYDGVILPHPQYDRAAHLTAIPAARDERVRRQREKSEKLSAHMRRRHATARNAATRRSEASRPSSTRRAVKAGGAR